MLVFGNLPSNSGTTDLPLINIFLDRGRYITPITKLSNAPLESHKAGQNGADGYSGTIKVPTALHVLAW